MQERSRAAVAAILEASARILRRDGLPGFNTNKVAERAGVSIGTLYGYFPDKSAILLALARRILEEDHAAILAALSEAPDQPARALIRALLRRHATDRPLRRIVMSHHVGMGFRGEHGAGTQAMVQRIVVHLAEQQRPAPDPVRFFTATRAVLGVCRTLIEEPEETVPTEAQLEEELLRLVQLSLGEALAGGAAVSPAAPAATAPAASPASGRRRNSARSA